MWEILSWPQCFRGEREQHLMKPSYREDFIKQQPIWGANVVYTHKPEVHIPEAIWGWGCANPKTRNKDKELIKLKINLSDCVFCFQQPSTNTIFQTWCHGFSLKAGGLVIKQCTEVWPEHETRRICEQWLGETTFPIECRFYTSNSTFYIRWVPSYHVNHSMISLSHTHCQLKHVNTSDSTRAWRPIRECIWRRKWQWMLHSHTMCTLTNSV